ncbi:MAG: amino acid adenylation domain-containing protein, partial [Nostocaceae cyanobacterium]|nr:amino acid adenylation domain-containing protein [Nostocaceae cyanobacterium]
MLDKCVHQLFEEQVKKTPDEVAVLFEQEQLTYQELNSQANKLAHYLQSMGVSPDVLVGICLQRSVEMVVGVLGILKAGGAYVPIDPAYPIDRIAYMLENSQASVLLTQKNLLPRLPKSQAKIICLDPKCGVVSQENDFKPNCSVSRENLAYVIYTSGSTGKPKGVAMKHLALTNLILWQLENTTVSPKAKTLQFAPISFDVSFQEIFSTWCGGGTLVLISEEVRRDPVALLHLLREKQIERLFLPFVALQQLAQTTQTLGLIPTSLREVITAGEQLQITRVIASFFSQLKDCSLHNQYGPSETHVVVTAFTLTGSTDNWSALPPIGCPIVNTQIYILDQFAQPVPVGIPGELYIGGVCLARGYLNRPELTAERFIPNPFSQEEGSRLYKTGDLARYLPDGNIEYLGRIDNQVKVRGFRIELGEIEVTLAQHPDLRQTAVILREDQPGDKRLVAYVCPNEGSIPTSGQLRRFLWEKLPDYMVPGTFVTLEALPLTPSGKVDRRALPAPDASSLIRETSFVAPRDSVELQLAQIWSEILGVSPIGVDDNLIELGGHSLLASKIIGLVRDRFGVELPLNCLFECPTVAELAKEVLQQEGLTIGPPLQPISREQTIPLSFAQEQLWFLNQLTPEEPVYNETLSIHLGGDINIPALAESLTELIRRHEILRTTYRVLNGQLCQEIHPPSAFALPIVDLREWSET